MAEEKYWEKEIPFIVDSEFIRIQWFKEAKRLQITRLWPTKDGSVRHGSTVTLAQEDCQRFPAFTQALQDFLNITPAHSSS